MVLQKRAKMTRKATSIASSASSNSSEASQPTSFLADSENEEVLTAALQSSTSNLMEDRFYMVASLLTLGVMIAANLILVDYSKHPITIWVGAAGSSAIFGVYFIRRTALTITLPVVSFTGVAFWSLLLVHALYNPHVAPAVFSAVYNAQLTMSATWFVLGFFAGCEAAPPRLRMFVIAVTWAAIEARAVVLSSHLREPGCVEGICLPGIRELARRTQITPAFFGYCLGWFTRRRLDATYLAAAAKLEELTSEVEWLRTHTANLEDARRGQLVSQAGAMAVPLDPIGEAAPNPGSLAARASVARRLLEQAGAGLDIQDTSGARSRRDYASSVGSAPRSRPARRQLSPARGQQLSPVRERPE